MTGFLSPAIKGVSDAVSSCVSVTGGARGTGGFSLLGVCSVGCVKKDVVRDTSISGPRDLVR